MTEKFYSLTQACRKMLRDGCIMTSDSLPKNILGVRNEKNKVYQEWYDATKNKWEMCVFPIEALTWSWYRVCANELFELYLQYLAEKNKKHR